MAALTTVLILSSLVSADNQHFHVSQTTIMHVKCTSSSTTHVIKWKKSGVTLSRYLMSPQRNKIDIKKDRATLPET